MSPPDPPDPSPDVGRALGNAPARELLRRDLGAWKEIVLRTRDEVRSDNATLAAAGVAFYSFLAVIPALIALVAVYGMVADPADIERQVVEPLGAAPEEVRELLSKQLTAIAEGERQGQGFAAAAGLLIALWSASTGMKHLIRAVNAAYNREETRGFFRLRGLALLFTLGGLVLAMVALVAINVAPAMLTDLGFGPLARGAVTVGRWPLLGALVLVALTLLYRYAPDRRAPRWGWSAPGTVVAVVGWLVTSGSFSLYTSWIGTFGETYGSLGTVVVLLLWLLLSALAVIIGAEINSESERYQLRRRPGRTSSTGNDPSDPSA